MNIRRDWQLQLQATPLDEPLIKSGAEHQGLTTTDLEEKAQQVLDDTPFILQAVRWKELIGALDQPAQQPPRPRRVFRGSRVAKWCW